MGIRDWSSDLCSAELAKIEIGERLKGRLERGQAFGGRFGARKFLMVEGERSVGIMDRDERTRKPPFAKGAVGAVLAFKREGVELRARNPLARRHRGGADARPAARREGKECVSTWKSGVSP